MATNVARHVLDSVRSDLPPVEEWTPALVFRDSLALSILNSTLGLRADTRSVGEVLDNYRQNRHVAGADAQHDSAQDLLDAIDEAGGARAFSLGVLHTEQVLPDDAHPTIEAVRDGAKVLVDAGIVTTQDFRVGSRDDPGAVEKRWLAIDGLDPSSWNYLIVNAGVADPERVDRRVRAFLDRVTGEGSTLTDDQIPAVLAEVAGELNVEPSALVHSIWSAERRREHAARGVR